MKLEEIRDMDTEPFDEKIFEEVYYRDYASNTMMGDGFAMLIFQYLMKFDEQYGTELARGIDMMSVMPDTIRDTENMLWYENIRFPMSEALYQSGWSMEWLSINEEDISKGMKEHEEPGEAFHKFYKAFLDEYYADCFVKSCLLQEEEAIRETICYLEDNEIGVFWNENLEKYKKYRRENEEVIAAVCPEEDYYISALQGVVWEPLIISYVQKTAKYEGIMYGLIILGCDGYNYCTNCDVNPNWIFRALKLGWMLELAWEKIECYENVKRGEKAA